MAQPTAHAALARLLRQFIVIYKLSTPGRAALEAIMPKALAAADPCGRRDDVAYILRSSMSALARMNRAEEAGIIAVAQGRAPSWEAAYRLKQDVIRELELLAAEADARATGAQIAAGAQAPQRRRRRRRVEWLAAAMLTVQEHPDWSDRRIAEEEGVGVAPSQLSRSKEYQRAAAHARGDRSEGRAGYVAIDRDTRRRDVDGIVEG